MKSTRGNFVIVSDSQQQPESGFAQLPFAADDFDQLSLSLANYGGIILDIANKAGPGAFLQHVRRQPDLCLKPIFLSASLGDVLDALADGIVAEYGQAVTRAESIFTKLEALEYDFQEVLKNPLFRILLFIYSRNRVISPVKNWALPSLYIYPIIESLIGSSEHAEQWLDTQTQRLLLEKDVLVDRVRCCPHCHLAKPNYIDVCCNCRSIHIHQDAFLHCFTCGTVQPEKDFYTTAGTLACPQCKERLRHIGTDYDRPLENYRCQDCQSTFSEPLIVAVCPRCDTVSDTEDLAVKSYTGYTLTAKGVTAAQTGYLSEPAKLMDDLQNVSFEHFIFQLQWFFAMVTRYKEEIFTIFAIRLSNLDQLEKSLGRTMLFELMEEYVKRVRSSLRGTDFSSRGKDNDLWFILPKTDIKQRQNVLSRITAFMEETNQVKNQVGLEMSIAALTIPTETTEHDTPEKVLTVLNAHLGLE